MLLNFYKATGWRRLFLRFQHVDVQLADRRLWAAADGPRYYTGGPTPTISINVPLTLEELSRSIETAPSIPHLKGLGAIFAALRPQHNNCATAIGRALGYRTPTPDHLLFGILLRARIEEVTR